MGEVVGGKAKSEGEQLLNRQLLTTSPVSKVLGSLWELPGFLLRQPLLISPGWSHTSSGGKLPVGLTTQLGAVLLQQSRGVTFQSPVPGC